jgi:hypothetical protein
MRSMDGQYQLRRLLGSARLGDPRLIGADTAAVAVRPYAWLLDRIGDDGIKLTQAGYLPPVHVEAPFIELECDKVWIGAGNREDLTFRAAARGQHKRIAETTGASASRLAHRSCPRGRNSPQVSQVLPRLCLH